MSLEEDDQLAVRGVGEEVHRDCHDGGEWSALHTERRSPTETGGGVGGGREGGLEGGMVRGLVGWEGRRVSGRPALIMRE